MTYDYDVGGAKEKRGIAWSKLSRLGGIAGMHRGGRLFGH